MLNRHPGYDAVHIVSHATTGALHLGTDWLDSANVGGYAADLRGWAADLNPGADILLYGCGLAGDAAGRAFVEHLAALTGADVAASTDPTGAAALGGNWALEYHTGPIETAPPFDPARLAAWDHTLASSPALFLTTDDNVSSSGTPGLNSWSREQVLGFGDPNLALEPGTTRGTFSSALDLRRSGPGTARSTPSTTSTAR